MKIRLAALCALAASAVLPPATLPALAEVPDEVDVVSSRITVRLDDPQTPVNESRLLEDVRFRARCSGDDRALIATVSQRRTSASAFDRVRCDGEWRDVSLCFAAEGVRRNAVWRPGSATVTGTLTNSEASATASLPVRTR